MKLHSACTLDCPDSCSFLVDKRPDGSVRVTGHPDHPFTRGVCCAKGMGLPRRLARPDRITRPLLRQENGEFAPISWDAALDLCAEKIAALAAEPASLLYLHGFSYHGVLAKAGDWLFGSLAASTKTGSMCDEAGCEAFSRDFGAVDQNDPLELLHAARIVNWGKDLSRSGVHTGMLVRQARKAGTRVLTVSPGGDGNAPFSDAFIRVRPGTDRFLAAAVIRILFGRGGPDPAVAARVANFEEFRAGIEAWTLQDCLTACQVGRAEAEGLADWFTAPGPVSTIIGWGVQRHPLGGENVRLINALCVLAGQIGRPGAGASFGIGSGRNLGPGFDAPVPGFSRRLLLPRLGREMLEANPPVRFVWVDGMNPVAMLPEAETTARAFETRDFVVVMEAFLTDTARRAHLILPCALPLEREDILGSYQHDWVHHAARVLDPPGEVRTDHAIYSGLAARLGLPLPSAEDSLRRALSASPTLRVTLEEMRARGFVRADRPTVAFPGLAFAHPDGRCRLAPALTPEPAPEPGFPLRLLTLISRRTLNSQTDEGPADGPPVVQVAPDCHQGAEFIGGPAHLATPLGRLPVRVEGLDGLHPGSVVMRRGGWLAHGRSANPIIAPLVADLGGQTAYYGQYARLEP
jgi:anaerobic selenocysteine-containing dehydrogenase